MTHQLHPSTTRDLVEMLAEHGFDGMAQVMQLLINECMKLERQQFLGVGPYQRGEARNGRANGFKPKRVKTRVGKLQLDVPQVRDAKFYPSALEKGCRWREFLKSLLARGLHGVELITSDAHAGMAEARKACFTGVPWQRCQFHLQQNALQHAPTEELQREVTSDLKGVYDAADGDAAQEQLSRVVRKYEKKAPKLAAWIETNVPEGLTVFKLPSSHRKRLRTANMMERLNRELKRRTRVATLFPNEASLLRLVTSLVMEQSEEWETGKRYVTGSVEISVIALCCYRVVDRNTC